MNVPINSLINKPLVGLKIALMVFTYYLMKYFPRNFSVPTASSFKKSLINDVDLLKPPRYYVYGCSVKCPLD